MSHLGKVKLGDEYQYPIKGSVESSYKLDSGKSMKMKDVIRGNFNSKGAF